MSDPKKDFIAMLAKNVGNFNPVDTLMSLSDMVTHAPTGSAQKGFKQLGYTPPNLSQVGQNISNQGNELMSKDPNVSGKAATNMVLAGGIGDIGELGAVSKGESAILDAKGNPTASVPSARPSSETILDSRGNPVVISPNPTEMGSYKRLSPQNIVPNTDPRPRLDAPLEPEYPKVEGNPSATMMPPKESVAPVTKPVIPSQPELTAAQQKAFAKSGLDKYQLPAKYGDKRAPFEAIDKSVMANVIGGNSPEEILQNIPKAEQKVWGEVTKKAATIPAVDINQGVIAHIENNLQDLVKQGIITDTEAMQRLATEKTNIFSKTLDPLNPTSISGKNLVELQTGANAAAPKNIPQGMTRPEPYMNKAIAQGYRDAIGDMSPDIRYSYNQYSSIKRIGEMSNDFRNTPGKLSAWQKFRSQNIFAQAGEVGSAVGGVYLGLPTIENVGGTVLGLARPAINGLQNTLGYVPKSEAESQDNKKQVAHSPIIPQDASGRYTLPPSPNIAPLTPGTPEYTRANNALPGGSRQFMANSPQYMNTANAVNDDIKSGMPLNLMSKFKSAQDVQAYLSDPSNPYAKQLANIGSMNSKFMSAYQLINGTKPDDSQMISPGDSQEQFQEKYNQMIKFIYDNYSQYQVPYLQTTSAPMASPQGGGTVPYQQPQQNDDWSGMKQGAIPSVQGLPPIGAIPAQ